MKKILLIWFSYKYLVFFFITSLLFSGCATILRNENQTIRLRTNTGESPVSAIITKKEKLVPVSIPTNISIQDYDVYSTVRVIDPCYLKTEVALERRFSKAAFLNILTLGLGFLVDYYSGEMWTFRDVTEIPVIRIPSCDPALASTTDIAELQITETIDTADKSETMSDIKTANTAFELILSYVGAMKFEYRWGQATVKSYVKRDGDYETIADGNQKYNGYEISFQRPGITSGWDYTIFPRYVNQTIDISDFRKHVPEVTIPGTTTIPVVVTDYETDALVDPEDPNRYNIQLNSLGLLTKGQYNWVKPCRFRECSFLGNFALGISLLEYVNLKTDLGNDSVEESKWEWGHSFFAEASFSTYGILLPNSSFQLSFSYLWYPKLTLPRTLEFRDRVEYNETKQVYERKRVFLDEIELEIGTVQLSYTYLFE